MSEVQAFTWIIPLADIPPDGRKIARNLTPEECAALAAHAGIESIGALSAQGEVRPWANGFELDIMFSADVVQACVVTLEPVPDHVEGEFSRRYLPGIGDEEGHDIELAPDEEDPPEPLTGDSIDLGPALAEELILALNPYPRAPGAEVPEEARASYTAVSPFAVLERLKPKT